MTFFLVLHFKLGQRVLFKFYLITFFMFYRHTGLCEVRRAFFSGKHFSCGFISREGWTEHALLKLLGDNFLQWLFYFLSSFKLNILWALNPRHFFFVQYCVSSVVVLLRCQWEIISTDRRQIVQISYRICIAWEIFLMFLLIILPNN